MYTESGVTQLQTLALHSVASVTPFILAGVDGVCLLLGIVLLLYLPRVSIMTATSSPGLFSDKYPPHFADTDQNHSTHSN